MTETGQQSIWFREFVPTRANSSRLICFPHAGGSAAFFTPFARELAPDTEVLAVQYPGRQDRYREPLIGSIPDLVDAMLPAMEKLEPRRTAFLGHSMGAIVAYELARKLTSSSQNFPTSLIVSGRRAPSIFREDGLRWLDDDAVLRDVTRLGGTSRILLEDPEFRREIARVSRSDYAAVGAYEYQPGTRLTCPIVSLNGNSDPRVSLPDAQQWSKHTSGTFSLRVFTGGHFFITQHVRDVSEVIRSVLT